MTKQEFDTAFANGDIAVRANNDEERHFLYEYGKGISEVTLSNEDYLLEKFPYVIHYETYITGWTGEGELNGKSLSKIDFAEFYAVIHSLPPSEDEITDIEDIL